MDGVTSNIVFTIVCLFGVCSAFVIRFHWWLGLMCIPVNPATYSGKKRPVFGAKRRVFENNNIVAGL
jgi:hypothetical protein